MISPTYSVTISSAAIDSCANNPQSWIPDLANRSCFLRTCRITRQDACTEKKKNLEVLHVWEVLLHICYTLACVARVSIWFRTKERPSNGILGFGRARNETRAKKWKWGEGEGKAPPLSRSFTCAIFRAVFGSRSSFFAPKAHGNACYAG